MNKDALNVDKDGAYIFCSKNGREYELAEMLTIQFRQDSLQKSYDMVGIYDFDAPDPQTPGLTTVKLVNWFFGADLSLDETEQTIREYVDEYEEKLNMNNNSPKYNIVSKWKYGDCKGAIYIGLMAEYSDIVNDPEKLKFFADDLWKRLYNELSEEHPLFLGIKDDDYTWNCNTTEIGNYTWLRIYEEEGSMHCDNIDFTVEHLIDQIKTEDDFKNFIKAIEDYPHDENYRLYNLAFEHCFGHPAFDENGNVWGTVNV